MKNQVAFEKLGIGPFNLDRVAFSIGNIDIYWYAVLITAGMLLAVIFACRYSRRVGLKTDNLLDAALWGIPCALIGARLYYIIFALDEFRNADGSLSFSKMVNVRDGGLAIYGGVIAAVIVAAILCKVKKINFLNMFDVCSLGLLIGQGIGPVAGATLSTAKPTARKPTCHGVCPSTAPHPFIRRSFMKAFGAYWALFCFISSPASGRSITAKSFSVTLHGTVRSVR